VEKYEDDYEVYSDDFEDYDSGEETAYESDIREVSDKAKHELN